MAISSITRSVLALRTKIETPSKVSHSLRMNKPGESAHLFDVMEHGSEGSRSIFATNDRRIAQRALDRAIDAE